MLCVETSNHCKLKGYRTYGNVQNVIYSLHQVKEKMNTLRTIKRRKAEWIGHILRRNCLLKQVNEDKNKRDEKTKKKMLSAPG